MFRKTSHALAALFLTTALTLTSACKPTYPHCKTDDNCHERGEVCVNGQCQECRDEAQCDLRYPNERRSCIEGRCEAKLECHLDADCAGMGSGLICRANKCVPECVQDADCGSGRRCNAQRCVAECAQDGDCGAGRSCQSGTCTGSAAPVQMSPQCAPRGNEAVHLETVHFEFNQYDLTPEARQQLDLVAGCIKEAPAAVHVVAEGHCDDRGTQEYNLALGERRAQAVFKYLKTLGVEAERLSMRSKGENEPVCNDASEACYAQNRRVQFVQQAGGY
jgi:peptidoglycan-associated lipoprotein